MTLILLFVHVALNVRKNLCNWVFSLSTIKLLSDRCIVHYFILTAWKGLLARQPSASIFITSQQSFRIWNQVKIKVLIWQHEKDCLPVHSLYNRESGTIDCDAFVLFLWRIAIMVGMYWIHSFGDVFFFSLNWSDLCMKFGLNSKS